MALFIQKKIKNKKAIALTLIALFFPTSLIYAYVMGSNNYRINSDSVNVGGTDDSASLNYSLKDTLGEIGTGTSTSTNYAVNAGYRQMQNSYISISSVNNGTMSSINGLSGGTSNASTTWTVITDNAAGYSLSIRSETSPAMQSSGGASLADYLPSGTDPDFDFNNTASESQFGFTPEGIDVTAEYLDNGSICNTGTSNTTDKCWDGLSTSNKIVASGATSNQPNGATTTVKYRAVIGSSRFQDMGSYSVTVVATALAL